MLETGNMFFLVQIHSLSPVDAVTYRTVSQKVFDHMFAYSLPDLLGTCWMSTDFSSFLLWGKGPTLLFPPQNWQNHLPADVAVAI